MRTVKLIKEQEEQALQKYNEHVNTCSFCQDLPIGEGEYSCPESEWLYEEYEGYRSAVDYAEQVFQAELKERNPVKLTNEHFLFRLLLQYISHFLKKEGFQEEYKFLIDGLDMIENHFSILVDRSGTIEFLQEHGGYNDVEIMLNVYTKFF